MQTTPVPTTSSSDHVISWGYTQPTASFSITITVGQSVTWIGVDSAPHTVTSGSNGVADGKFSSGAAVVGLSYTHTFTTVGTFPYFCQVHSMMVGVITVVASSPSQPASSSSTTTATTKTTSTTSAASVTTRIPGTCDAHTDCAAGLEYCDTTHRMYEHKQGTLPSFCPYFVLLSAAMRFNNPFIGGFFLLWTGS